MKKADDVADKLKPAQGLDKIACLCMKTPTQHLDDGTEVAIYEVIGQDDEGKPIQRPKPALRGRTADGGICPDCLGYCWHWTDGVPPTACPGNKRPTADNVSPKKAIEVALTPCGRRGDRCPCCSRGPVSVGDEDDRARSLLLRRELWDLEAKQGK